LINGSSGSRRPSFTLTSHLGLEQHVQVSVIAVL
jgi:hypothetical protein